MTEDDDSPKDPWGKTRKGASFRLSSSAPSSSSSTSPPSSSSASWRTRRAANAWENLVLAKRNIDLLDLLKDRSKGNLEPKEEKFLDGVLDQLKLAYLKSADIVKM